MLTRLSHPLHHHSLLRIPHSHTHLTRLPVRNLTTSPNTLYPRKTSQDKDSIEAESTEYSKSGTDDGAACQEQAAFDPNLTDPAAEKEKAGEGMEDKPNPLEVSPANPDVSQAKTKGGRAENSGSSAGQKSERQGNSGKGSPKKGKKVS